MLILIIDLLNYTEVLPMKKVLSTLVAAIVALSFSAVVFAAETTKTDVKKETTTTSPAGEVKVEKKEVKKVVKKKKAKKAKKEAAPKTDTTTTTTTAPAAPAAK
jgi:mannitol-specific phosphotransferase system IIBC component